MDALNRFETKKTFLWTRLEWLAGLGIAVFLTLTHLGDIRWPVFIALFLVIDLVGYVPGAIAYRRAGGGDIAKGYYVAYNVMHSLLTSMVLAGLWAWLVEPEWALLALPVHLFGDRGLFGNSLKPLGTSFEPIRHPAFADFEGAYASAASPSPAVAAAAAAAERNAADAVSPASA
ncbi:membrane protein [Streptomyces sp. NRRL WC-3742]|uniref:membrane protein n=1 Tax=Streptomyces sp. NRRL WC-3742 TaxID=1463934 RepID=UPI0004CA3AF1|nr:membrane protein [Streptomyces sp. NRRL WC-3742]